MTLPRAAIPRPVLSAWQAARPPTRPRLNWNRWQQFVRRTYASHEGHGSAKSGSDLPWSVVQDEPRRDSIDTFCFPLCLFLQWALLTESPF